VLCSVYKDLLASHFSLVGRGRVLSFGPFPETRRDFESSEFLQIFLHESMPRSHSMCAFSLVVWRPKVTCDVKPGSVRLSESGVRVRRHLDGKRLRPQSRVSGSVLLPSSEQPTTLPSADYSRDEEETDEPTH